MKHIGLRNVAGHHFIVRHCHALGLFTFVGNRLLFGSYNVFGNSISAYRHCRNWGGINKRFLAWPSSLGWCRSRCRFLWLCNVVVEERHDLVLHLVLFQVKVLAFFSVDRIYTVGIFLDNAHTSALYSERIFVALYFCLFVQNRIDDILCTFAALEFNPFFLGDFFKFGDIFR